MPLTREIRENFGMSANDKYCFSVQPGGVSPIKGFAKWKKALDQAINDIRKAEGRDKMPNWRLHDLRRTHRTLISRARIANDVGERVHGHKIGGTRAHYDLWEYEQEKREALEKVAELINTILKGPGDGLAEPAVTPYIAGSPDDSKKTAKRRQKRDQHLTKALREALGRDLWNAKKLNSGTRRKRPPDRPADVIPLRRPLEVLGEGQDEG